ncbi:hypothetical protein ACHAXT_002592 [Thalassiosira profunda]
MKISEWESTEDLAYAAVAARIDGQSAEDITTELLYKVSCRKAGAFDRFMKLARKEQGIETTLADLKQDAELCDMILDHKTNNSDEYYDMVRVLAREEFYRGRAIGRMTARGEGRQHEGGTQFDLMVHLLMERHAPWSELTAERIETMLDEEEELAKAGSSAPSTFSQWAPQHYKRATLKDVERLLDGYVKFDAFDAKLILSALIPTSPELLRRLAHQEVTKCEAEEDLGVGCSLEDMALEGLLAICEQRGLLEAMNIAAAAKQNKLTVRSGKEIYRETFERSLGDYVIDAQNCLKIEQFKRDDLKEYNRLLKNLIAEKIDMFAFVKLSDDDQLKTENLISGFETVMARYDPHKPLTLGQVEKLFTDPNAFQRWEDSLQRRGHDERVEWEMRMLRTYEFTFDDYDEQHILPALLAVTPNALDMLASRSVESPQHPALAVFKKTLWSNMRLAFFSFITLVAVLLMKKKIDTNARHSSSKERRNRPKKKANKKKKTS